jgi:histone deacetylase 1/2
MSLYASTSWRHWNSSSPNCGVGLALLAHSYLPNIFWEDASSTAVYIINRLSTLILQHKSPYEMVNNSKPDFNFLLVFGCACWPYLHPYNKHKMDFWSKTCIFIGYSIGHRGYKCLDVSTGKIYGLFPVFYC